MVNSDPIDVRLAQVDDRGSILALHKARKATLGHLPDDPFDRAIEYGWILVATRGSRLLGYLLYRIRKTTDDVAVVHLAVALDAERAGVGQALVDRLLTEVAAYRRVVLSCRQDYPAHEFWKRAGFEAIDVVMGRSREGALLTRFERRLRMQPTLFDQLFEESVPFAVDLNILLDLVLDREPETRGIFDQLDQFDVHPLRTTALSNELIGYKDQSVQERARVLISVWEAGGGVVRLGRLAELQTEIPEADEADLLHLASAEANGVGVLVSRDRSFADAVARCAPGTTTVEVLHPAVFVDRLFRADTPDYLPSAVRGLASHKASGFSPTSLADLFVASSYGEKKAEFRADVVEALASDSIEVNCLTRHGDPVCLFASSQTRHEVNVRLFRCIYGEDRSTIVRQAVAHLRTVSASAGAIRVLNVTDPTLLPRDFRQFRAEGFLEAETGWTGLVGGGVHTRESLTGLLPLREQEDLDRWRPARRAVSDASVSADAAALVEALLDPLVLLDGALESVLVPIQAGWSDRLIGVTADQLDLEVASQRIHQLREHVYFRSPSGLSLTAPTRVFWYRTAEGRSRVFATSVIDQVTVKALPEIWGRFGGYGVLKRAEIAGLADDAGRVMALRFVRTRRLQRSVELSELQDVSERLGAVRPTVPVGPLRLDHRLQSWLLSDEVGLE